MTKIEYWTVPASPPFLYLVEPIALSLKSWIWLWLHFPVSVLTSCTYVYVFPSQLPVMTRFFKCSSYGAGQYSVYVLQRCGVTHFSCGGHCFPLLSLFLVEEKLKGFPRLEFGWLSAPFPNVVVESCPLCQKGDPFWHHHVVGNSLPSWSCKFPPLFVFFDETVKGFCIAICSNNLDNVLLEVDFVNFL